ncbi:hypothetical protein ACFSOZ_37810 [Mesorhizobium newzealandense]|uniref:Uncharacterized protein n=1 Tax=Mesorhizobium newzealandense TaxID=1300302 RepID=A0ABW4UMI9_9HYPH
MSVLTNAIPVELTDIPHVGAYRNERTWRRCGGNRVIGVPAASYGGRIDGVLGRGGSGAATLYDGQCVWELCAGSSLLVVVMACYSAVVWSTDTSGLGAIGGAEGV